MRSTSHVSLPVPEPLALLDATLLFLIQVLLAEHPDLLAPPEEAATLRPAPPLRAARHLFEVVRDLHDALGSYRAALPDAPGSLSGAEDDIPF